MSFRPGIRYTTPPPIATHGHRLRRRLLSCRGHPAAPATPFLELCGHAAEPPTASSLRVRPVPPRVNARKAAGRDNDRVAVVATLPHANPLGEHRPRPEATTVPVAFRLLPVPGAGECRQRTGSCPKSGYGTAAAGHARRTHRRGGPGQAIPAVLG